MEFEDDQATQKSKIKVNEEEAKAIQQSMRISIKVSASTMNNPYDDGSIMRLKRYTTFKRDKSYVVYSYGDYIFVDGLNENVDIFRLSDFSLVGTLDTGEKSMTSAIIVKGEYLFIGC